MKDPGPTREGPWTGGGPSELFDETVVHEADGAVAAPAPRAEFAPGTSISRYVVLYEVGAGGMGVVYAAFDPQLNRKIALKILTPKANQRRRGVDRAVARLMREAQAIARLSHPNVVNVYDVGRHGDAVFVAMEFIEGLTLTKWLEPGRTLEEIRGVFALAGRGLAAAHDAGLVHRDFKPDNVLVSADGRVRVLDFGLARADPTHSGHLSHVSQISHISGRSLDDDSAEDDEEPLASSDRLARAYELSESNVLTSPLTLDDAVVGTPRYMAPEQHTGSGVDARCDQFSFCVALYQAIYRQEPFPASRLHELVVLKQEGRVAAPPSDSSVPSWLGALVLRGLSPRPRDRWPSMDEVVAALERDDEGRRRRWLALGSGAMLLAAATALVGHQLGTAKEGPCQDGAGYLEGLWDVPRREAVRKAMLDSQLPYAEHTWNEVARRVDDDLDDWVSTYRDTCEATRVRGDQSDELLDLRMACLQEHLSEVRAVLDVLDDGDPAAVQRAVSMVSGLPDLEPCADVEQLRANLPPPEDEATRERVEQLRQKLRDSSALRAVRRVDEGRALAQEVLSEAETLGYEPLRIEALVALGATLENVGEYPEAETRLREAMWAALRIGHDKVASRAAIQLVSVVGDRLARHDEGLTWYEQASAMLDRIGDTGHPVASLLNNVGNVWHRKGDNDKALDFYRRSLAIREELSGTEDPVVATERINLGNAQLALGQHDAALASYLDAQAVLERTLGAGHPQISMAVASIGIVYNQTGRYTEALQKHREALPAFEAWLGPEHLFVATTISNMGVALRGLQRYDEAEAQFLRAQAMFEKSLGADHPEVARCLANLASVRIEQGRYDEATALEQRALQLRSLKFDDDNEGVVSSRTTLAELRRLRGDAAGAVVELEALAQRGQQAELDAALRGEIHFDLAKARWDAGQGERRVRADLERARVFLREAGARGDSERHEVEEWERRHPVDDRPRAEDGTILPLPPPSPGEGSSDDGRGAKAPAAP